MASTRDAPDDLDLSEAERTAMHEVELATEWVHRAHGHLLAFHHAVGHGMDHLAAAEPALREAGYADLADAVRDDLLPRGVTDDDRWSYDLVEAFQAAFLADVTGFERRARRRVADGERHVVERAQEARWRGRADQE
jgi:hypothetical protein